jgi:hypothetical protein
MFVRVKLSDGCNVAAFDGNDDVHAKTALGIKFFRSKPVLKPGLVFKMKFKTNVLIFIIY